MFLTKFLFCLVPALAQTSHSALFGDCEIDLCTSDRVEMDITGKFWPRYCYKCPEGEDEVVFLREYLGDGWKYLVRDSSDYEGRLILTIVPCEEPEIDSMGNYWTSWCFDGQRVNFERVGTRIWIYKQDYAGGYPQLQFRRIINDQVFAQIAEEIGGEGGKGEEFVEVGGEKGIQISKKSEEEANQGQGDEGTGGISVEIREEESIGQEGLIDDIRVEASVRIADEEELEDDVEDIEGKDQISSESVSEIVDKDDIQKIHGDEITKNATTDGETKENQHSSEFKPLIHPDIIEESENTEEVVNPPSP